MHKLGKRTAAAVIGIAIGIAAAPSVLAKGHDQGVADGSPSETTLTGRQVAGRDVRGVGGAIENFLGVAADLTLNIRYGDLVKIQAAEGTRRTVPVVGNKPRK
jgi:hypothetical protein